MSLRRQLQDALRTGDVLDLESAIEGAKSAMAANAVNGSLDTSRSTAPRSMSGLAELERLILEAKHAFLKAMERCKHLLKPLRRAVREVDGPKVVEALALVYRSPDAAQHCMAKDVRHAEKMLELMSQASLGAEAMLTTKRWDEVDRYLNNFASVLPQTVVLELTAVRDSLFHLTSPTRDHISPSSTSPVDRMIGDGGGEGASSAFGGVRLPFSPPFSHTHRGTDVHRIEARDIKGESWAYRTTLPDDVMELHRRLTMSSEWAASERSSSAVQRSHRAADAFFAATLEATLSVEESVSRNHLTVVEKRERAQVYHVIFRDNCVSDLSLSRIERRVFHCSAFSGVNVLAPTTSAASAPHTVVAIPLQPSTKAQELLAERSADQRDDSNCHVRAQASAREVSSAFAADRATPQSSARSGSQSPVRVPDGSVIAGARMMAQQLNSSSATSCSMSLEGSRTSSPVPQVPLSSSHPPPHRESGVAAVPVELAARRLPADVLSKLTNGEASGRRFLEESEAFARSTDLATKHSRLALAIQAAGGSSRHRLRVVLSPGEVTSSPTPPLADGVRLGRWGMHQDPYAAGPHRVSPERVLAAYGTQRTYVVPSTSWQLHSPSPPSAMGDD